MTKAAGRYQARMERVTRHIETALRDGESVTVEELAAVAALSPFHFHRLYRILTGEPVGQTLRRLRLADALARTQAGETVTAAAHGAGFDSSQSLARAAQRQAGASVTQLRTDGRLAAETERLASPEGDHAIAIELVEHAPITLACRLSVGPYPQLNRAYWALFEDLMAAAPQAEMLGVYGVPLDDPRDVPEAEHRFLCAIAAGELPDPIGKGIELRRIGGGQHARGRFVGPYSDVPDAIDHLYAGLIAEDRPLADEATFVHYVDQPAGEDGPDAVHVSDIYIPLASGWDA